MKVDLAMGHRRMTLLTDYDTTAHGIRLNSGMLRKILTHEVQETKRGRKIDESRLILKTKYIIVLVSWTTAYAFIVWVSLLNMRSL